MSGPGLDAMSGPDSVDVMIVSPDCRDRKHHACDSHAWDLDADRPASCECPCHVGFVELPNGHLGPASRV